MFDLVLVETARQRKTHRHLEVDDLRDPSVLEGLEAQDGQGERMVARLTRRAQEQHRLVGPEAVVPSSRLLPAGRAIS
ncbi:hypothetical protein [Mesorhizobium sp. M0185]|uniref:hypothetical protein n=1 Tax=unclassified Mesorhizobium TaxID=325217 RepID=UPI003338A1D2